MLSLLTGETFISSLLLIVFMNQSWFRALSAVGLLSGLIFISFFIKSKANHNKTCTIWRDFDSDFLELITNSSILVLLDNLIKVISEKRRASGQPCIKWSLQQIHDYSEREDVGLGVVRLVLEDLGGHVSGSPAPFVQAVRVVHELRKAVVYNLQVVGQFVFEDQVLGFDVSMDYVFGMDF